MAKDHGSSIKDDEQYEALRDEGMSKEKAARIANESAGSSRSDVGSKGGSAEDYEDRTVDELRDSLSDGPGARRRQELHSLSSRVP